jgi:hypothetical protein
LGCDELIKALPKMKVAKNNINALADHNEDHFPICSAYFLMSRYARLEPEDDGYEPPVARPHIERALHEHRMRELRQSVLGNESVR